MTERKYSRTFELIISRAVTDSCFRERLLEDKKSVVEEYQLKETDINAIMKIDKEILENARQTAAMIGVVHLDSED